MTVTYSRSSLSREITDIEQVIAMDDAQLRVLMARHQAEILGLRQRIQRSNDHGFKHRGKLALDVLNLHKSWIDSELNRRKRDEQRSHEKELKADARATAETNRQANQEGRGARLARIDAANSETLRAMRHFKKLVRDHVGEDVYAAMWMETERLLEEEDAATAKA